MFVLLPLQIVPPPLTVAVGLGMTVSVSTAEVLVLKLPSPLYTAVIEWVAAESVEVVNVALPELSVPLPSEVAPSRNVTVPLGVPVPGATTATIPVKVTDCAKQAGLSEAASVIVVSALLTFCVSAAEVLL